MVARRILSLILVMAAIALGACGQEASLSPDEVEEVLFTALDSGHSRVASETEVRLLVEYYAEARKLSDDRGTTPPARIDVRLDSGETLVVWGGGEIFQTVGWGGRQYNIEGERLHQMLQGIASEP